MVDSPVRGFGSTSSFRRRLRERVGTTFGGRYTLDALIGIGGMGSVYRAHHRNGHRVALKVLHRELAAHPESRARFLREGYVANRVEHPGVVKVLDDDTSEDGSVFLVMELLEGETLADRLTRRGPMAPSEIVPLVLQLLEVLVAAHAKGIVHRDLKPENLFLTREGLKVLDFGLARLRDGGMEATATGWLIGTPLYMAPEQVKGRTDLVGPQSDIWAVGAILFRALTGSCAFSRHPLELEPRLSPGLVALLESALARSQERRFKNALEMLSFARSMDRIRAPREEVASPPDQLPLAHRAAFVIVIAMLAVVTTMVSVMLFHTRMPSHFLLTRAHHTYVVKPPEVAPPPVIAPPTPTWARPVHRPAPPPPPRFDELDSVDRN